eukprot:351962-Chlamydomonas_euryale.AAC.3
MSSSELCTASRFMSLTATISPLSSTRARCTVAETPRPASSSSSYASAAVGYPDVSDGGSPVSKRENDLLGRKRPALGGRGQQQGLHGCAWDKGGCMARVVEGVASLGRVGFRSVASETGVDRWADQPF